MKNNNKPRLKEGFIYNYFCLKCGNKTVLFKNKKERYCNYCGSNGNDFIFISKEKSTIKKLQEELKILNESLMKIIKRDLLEKEYNNLEEKDLKALVLRKKMQKLLSLENPPQKEIDKLIKKCNDIYK